MRSVRRLAVVLPALLSTSSSSPLSKSTSSAFAAAAFGNNLSNNKSSISSAHQTTHQQQRRFLSAKMSGGGDNSNDEVKKAQEAAAAAASAASDGGEPTVFDKILSGEWSSTKVYDDELCYGFRDINPQAPTHVVLIPKRRDGLTQLSKARKDQADTILGHLLYVAGQIGKQECPDGFRIVVNDGKDGAQSVYHLHLHILGGKQMGWPPG